MCFVPSCTNTWEKRKIQCAAFSKKNQHDIPLHSEWKLKDFIQSEIWRETTRCRKRRFIGKVAVVSCYVLLSAVARTHVQCMVNGFVTRFRIPPPLSENWSLRLFWFVFSMYFTGIRLVIRCTGPVTAVSACKRVSVSVCTSASPDSAGVSILWLVEFFQFLLIDWLIDSSIDWLIAYEWKDFCDRKAVWFCLTKN